MQLIIFLFVGILIGVVAGLVWHATREARRHGTGTAGELVGICALAFERASEKETRKEKALALLQERGELGNAEIREAIKVSARSVRRYMTELAQEGKAEQIGEVGRSVVYRAKV